MRVRRGASAGEVRSGQWMALSLALALGKRSRRSRRPDGGLAGRVVVERRLARAPGAEAVPTYDSRRQPWAAACCSRAPGVSCNQRIQPTAGPQNGADAGCSSPVDAALRCCCQRH